MKELYSNLWSGLGSLVQSWLLPSVVGLGFFTIALVPAVNDRSPWLGVAKLEGTQQAFLFAFLAVLLSFFLASTARPLTRFLEGYSFWPAKLRQRRTEKHRRRWQDLHAQVTAAPTMEEKLKIRESLNEYPRKGEFLMPTRLGNALRAGETYGWVQYGLSTVDLWSRLTAVGGEQVNVQLAQAEIVLNFFIAMIWITGVLCSVSVLVALWSGHFLYALWLIPLLALVPLFYNRAISAVAWYSQGMMALVDLTRGKLAEALGLRLPGDLSEERKIWRAVSNYAAWGATGWKDASTWAERISAAMVPRGALGEPGDSREPEGSVPAASHQVDGPGQQRARQARGEQSES